MIRTKYLLQNKAIEIVLKRSMAVANSSRLIVLGIACLFMINGVVSQETVYDVTNYDAKADGVTDDATAFIQAWRAACDSTGPARMLVPPGKDFTLSEVVFAGPCKAPPPVIIDIQGNLSAVADPSSYSNGVWILIDEVDGVEVTGGGVINGHGPELWKYADQENHLPVSLIFQKASNCKLHNITLIDAMGFHSKVTDSHDILVTNITIIAPGKSPNTDGIHLSNATNVNITDSFIGTGDDCVSIGQGCKDVLVTRVYCGPGHGLSVGSLGKREDEESLSGITIINCTLNGTTNGARIKSYHESPKISATNIVFQDIEMTQVKNPIIIDQHYDSKRRREQSSVQIIGAKFINIRGSTISKIPIRLNCSSAYPCQDVELTNINLVPFSADMTNLTSACAYAQLQVNGDIVPPAPQCQN